MTGSAYASLVPYGWNDRWAALLAEFPDGSVPARVVRHDGAGLVVVTPDDGVIPVMFVQRLDPAPAVGDWVVLDDGKPVGVLARTSLLRRRAAIEDAEQVLAANVDVVLLVCGLDRPVKQGRVERGVTLARDAGATPVIVLTKAALATGVEATVAELVAANPGVDVLVTSVDEDLGVDRLHELTRDRTLTLLGESGAGKSSIVNALFGSEAAAVGHVRAGDAKGRHTTTSRQLHLLPAGGVIIDTPGIRAVGVWVDPQAVADAFADVEELADGCRFVDCGHRTEPGCLVLEAIAAGTLDAERLESWRNLGVEADAAAARVASNEQRQNNKKVHREPRESRDTGRRKSR